MSLFRRLLAHLNFLAGMTCLAMCAVLVLAAVVVSRRAAVYAVLYGILAACALSAQYALLSGNRIAAWAAQLTALGAWLAGFGFPLYWLRSNGTSDSVVTLFVTLLSLDAAAMSTSLGSLSFAWLASRTAPPVSGAEATRRFRLLVVAQWTFYECLIVLSTAAAVALIAALAVVSPHLVNARATDLLLLALALAACALATMSLSRGALIGAAVQRYLLNYPRSIPYAWQLQKHYVWAVEVPPPWNDEGAGKLIKLAQRIPVGSWLG